MENKYSAYFFLSLQKPEYSTRCLSVMLIVTLFSSSNMFCDCLFPSSDKCFPLVIQLFVAVNFFFKLQDYKTAIILKSIFFLIYFFTRLSHRAFAVRDSEQPFITRAADRLRGGNRCLQSIRLLGWEQRTPSS